MKIDVTLKITPKMAADAQGNEKKVLVGHLGTHFDVMNKEFPLEYTERKAIVFDVTGITERDIDIGFIEKEGYGTPRYFREHPQLSNELIDFLLQKNISIIGVDFAGVRRGKEHTPKYQYCADRGVFIIENLCNLKEILNAGGQFIAQSYPMNYEETTGLPCRVVAEL